VRQFAISAGLCAHDNRCDDIVVLDLRGISSVADYFVVGTGVSDRQIRAVADHIIELGKSSNVRLLGRDGYETAGWILLDFVDVVVHIFSPEYRVLYDLELLWGDAKKVVWKRRSPDAHETKK